MFRNTILILVALGVWALSSGISACALPGTTQLTDMLDLLGEVVFALGLVTVFARLAIGMARAPAQRRPIR
ncbi:hypothetical protein C0V97_10535 [Asaia sp. W19]|uniref:hypothetical protein n=1 Tax=unclassified Asaia TaxID=2685023 RepID=UPI000F8D0B65|nr:hypothetical protein [Asaia sp. W19]RUT25558.1 hypothetical protein C0V97_10535 [Asaia sp. W19]